MKLQNNRSSEFGFIPILVIGGILLVLVILFINGSNNAPTSFKSATITVNQLKDEVLDTTNADISIPFTTNKPEDTYTYNVKAYANGNDIVVVQRDPTTNPNGYDAIPGSYLKNGINNIKIETRINQVGDDDPLVGTKEFKVNLKATQAPVINIKNAVLVNKEWQVNDYKTDSFKLSVDTVPEDSKNSSASALTINDTPVSSAIKRGLFENEIKQLKDGINIFSIKARNDFGEVATTLKIYKLSKDEQDANAAFANTLVEAQAACAQYAEMKLNVKDINVSYDQSSLRKRNSDATFLIKANIADSNGLLGKQKPLGVMECSTDSTGKRVINFIHY